jgi:hypothetical protein
LEPRTFSFYAVQIALGFEISRPTEAASWSSRIAPATAAGRLATARAALAELVLVDVPVRAGCLNRTESQFLLVQRKRLEPTDGFDNLADIRAHSTPSNATATRSPSPSTGTSPAPTSRR